MPRFQQVVDPLALDQRPDENQAEQRRIVCRAEAVGVDTTRHHDDPSSRVADADERFSGAFRLHQNQVGELILAEHLLAADVQARLPGLGRLALAAGVEMFYRGTCCGARSGSRSSSAHRAAAPRSGCAVSPTTSRGSNRSARSSSRAPRSNRGSVSSRRSRSRDRGYRSAAPDDGRASESSQPASRSWRLAYATAFPRKPRS